MTFEQRLPSLKLRHAEADALLHVHAALLHELQFQLRNLTAVVQRMSHEANTSCMQTQITQYTCVCHSLKHISPSGGGWTVVQRRRDGSVSFNRGWSEYRDGFGEPRGEHWLGNRQLHLLSSQGQYSLRIDLQDWSHTHRHAHYHSFRIDDEENQYRLHVSGFSGTVEDSFSWYHNQQSFSTPDTGNICAEISHSGWWFHQCFYSNLNGVYYKNLLGPDGIVWFSWKDSDFYSLKAVVMMIRPRSFRPHLSP
uniref:Fibrinogen C-terminal domain-containing protein n=1 Tax=Echeneis naucrates TaxID=173247 RepID=A0A665UJD3_ECHNA